MNTTKRTFWGAAAFYFLIAFEFFYMASPFGVYFYSVYRPVLNFFNGIPVLSGLVKYFMPHFSQTTSAIINLHNIIGGILFTFGFLAFCIGAFQVYYYKLARKGVVTGGIYNFIRHPQYASFIIWSFGLLLLWPRYIVLIMFVTMLFAYFLLARAEEKECEAKFGQSYIEYKNKTGMFLPFRMSNIFYKLSIPTSSRFVKILTIFCVYVLVLTVAVGMAKGVDSYTINSLYAVYRNDSANISLCKIESYKLEKVLNIALSNEEIKARIDKAKTGKNTKFLNYVLPSEWYAAEVPMNGTGNVRTSHSMPAIYNENSYKIIFTKADLRFNNDSKGKDIIKNIVKREPIVEVWVDIAQIKVTKILEIPQKILYENIPVALY